MRPVQYFSDEYLEHCGSMSTEQICDFLESFRAVSLGSGRPKRKLISLRVQEPLLAAFKHKARALGVPYQRKIHELMEAWVRDGAAPHAGRPGGGAL